MTFYIDRLQKKKKFFFNDFYLLKTIQNVEVNESPPQKREKASDKIFLYIKR